MNYNNNDINKQETIKSTEIYLSYSDNNSFIAFTRTFFLFLVLRIYDKYIFMYISDSYTFIRNTYIFLHTDKEMIHTIIWLIIVVLMTKKNSRKIFYYIRKFRCLIH